MQYWLGRFAGLSSWSPFGKVISRIPREKDKRRKGIPQQGLLIDEAPTSEGSDARQEGMLDAASDDSDTSDESDMSSEVLAPPRIDPRIEGIGKRGIRNLHQDPRYSIPIPKPNARYPAVSNRRAFMGNRSSC